MASAFLKKKAEQSKQRIDHEYGHGTYGSSGASEFLKKKAAAAKEGIDVKFSDSAYGGSKYDMNKRSYATPDLFANLYDYASGLRSQLDTTKNAAHGSNFSDYANIKDYENSQSAKTALPDLQKQYDEAMQYYYSYLPYASDYAELSKAGDSKSNKSKLLSAYNIGGDTVYDYINNINGISETLGSQDAPKSPYTKYSYMNDDEKGVYNYVYAKYGKDAAASYLDSLTETLNYRYGNNIYENIKDKPALKYTTAASAGMQSFFEGMGQLFSKDALPTSETQYAYQNVQKDLADKGPKILSKSLGQIGADLIYTASNMLPSILLSVVGGQLLGAAGISTGTAAKLAGAAGAASLGTSAGGNAYNQAIKDGFTQEQAKNYAALIGVSESALQYALGGISKLGGLSANKIASIVGKIDSGFLRAAATIGIDMASEGIEEGLQEVLGTLFSNSILGTKDSVNWENVAYAAVLGAVMGGVFEGSNVALEGGVPYNGNDFTMSSMPGYISNSGIDYFEDVNDAVTLKAKYRELAKQYSPDLHQDRAAEYTEIMKDINNQHDMIEAFYRAKATVTGEEIQDETADAGYTAEDETGLIRLLNEGGTQKPVETVEDGLASPVEAVSEQQPITTPEAIKVLEQAATEMHSKPVEKPAISKPLEEKPAAVGPITSVAQPAAQTGNATKVPGTQIESAAAPRATAKESDMRTVLVSRGIYNNDGINYSISGSDGSGYFGTIEKVTSNTGYPVSDARNAVYKSQKIDTLDDAINDIIAVARNSNLLKRQVKYQTTKPLTTAKPESTIKADNTNTAEPAKPAETTDNKPDNTAKTLPKHEQIANSLYKMISNGEIITPDALFKTADKIYGGTMASGTYTIKDVYDSLELAVNMYILKHLDGWNANGISNAVDTIKLLEKMLRGIPTQTKRTPEMERYQQFSTPPNIAYIAAWAANIGKNDTVLEPSAGIGGIAVFAKGWGAKVYANELSKRRLEILKSMRFDETFNLDAEQIDNLLPDYVKPSVVLMNPPFSSAAERTTTNATANAKRHITQALERLEDGGRLVAIVGRGMADDAPSFKGWWKELKKDYNIRANIRIDGTNYAKYGTSFDIQLVVIDKTGNTSQTITGDYKNLYEIPKVLEGIKNERKPANSRTEQNASVDGVAETAQKPGQLGLVSDAGDIRSDKPISQGESGILEGRSIQGTVKPDGSNNTVRKPEESVQGDGTDGGRGTQGGNNAVATVEGDNKGGQVADTSGRSYIDTYGERIELDSEQGESERLGDAAKLVKNADNVYSDYFPKKLTVKGAKPHPANLVESAAMAAVNPPDITYTPNLPREAVTSGALSIAQLETIVYAGQSHSKFLKDGRRSGYFIGDGTGVGKGRQIAGIILDNMRQGRKKAVWISEKKGLAKDALRDWTGIGGDKAAIILQEKTKLKNNITATEGILFSTYDTIKSEKANDPNASRIKQIENWLGKDFDGVIVFDEAHNMANSVSQKGKRGKSKPSQKALSGIKLQDAFPKARIVYASATGASKVSDYAYLTRLGLWGEGTAFSDVNDFIAKISTGGLAAMELVARDMKSMGTYLARSISFEDVVYDEVSHNLTPMQHEIYDTMSRAWQKVLQNIEKALETTGANKNSKARSTAKSQFYGSLQRFYNQVITSMSMPSVIADIKRELDNNRSVVIQLVNTNQAAMERQIANMDEDAEYDDLDLTPSDTLLNYLENSFPIHEYEDIEDDNGNITSAVVTDGNGNPVVSKAAVRMRDALIAEVKDMKVPDGPLEMLFDTFGPEQVSEVTGRTRRLVPRKDSGGETKRVLESRTAAMNDADAQAFQDGKKRILVFSDAGGTGRSYHADRKAKNQQQRVHYLLQPGWNAFRAIQGIGRSHRSNQSSAPIIKLVNTDIMGQKRFVTTIARRLDQLGALTKGQRQAGSGVFSQKDNLEGNVAVDSLAKYYQFIPVSTLKKMGLYEKVYNKDDRYDPDQNAIRDMPLFLNRILALELDEQNKTFEQFYEIFQYEFDRAVEAGTVEIGIENVVAEKIEVKDEKIIKEFEGGASTKYVQLTAFKKPQLLTYAQVESYFGNYKGLVKLQNGDVRAVYQMANKTNIDGSVTEQYRLQSPMLGVKSMYVKKTLDEKTAPIPKKEWAAAWKEQTSKTPEYAEQTLHLLTGTLLPIWDKLPTDNTRVVRVITADGRQYLGRLIDPEQIDGVLRGFNVGRTKEIFTPEALYNKILKDGKTVVLANNRVKLERRRVSGEYRIEITGFNLWSVRRVPGVFEEKIGYTPRFFIQTSEKGISAIKQIVAENPVLDVLDKKQSDDSDDVDRLIYTDTKAQDIKSADTSINSAKLPAVFSRVTFEPGTVNLDIGGGRFDNVTEHLASIGVTNYIYDPYNRTNEHNDKVAKKTQEGQSDTVTISNVLNVIKEQKARDNVIANAVDAVKTNGTVYITVYEGNGQGEGRQTTKGWQENRKTVTYMSEIRKFFSEVTLRNNVIIAKYPNKMAGKEITDKAMTGGADRASQWQTTRTEGNAATAIPLSHLIKKIRDKYELPVSTGHIRGKGVLGQYARLSKSIRSRVANDMPTIAHELGHHFDNIHQITDTLKPTLKAELTSALSDEMRAAYKENKLPGEGMAEFLRKYLQNKDKATEEYKLFTPYFLEKLAASERIMLDEFSDQINAYYSQEILEKARGTIFTQESKAPDYRTKAEAARDYLDYMYQKTVDSNHAIKMFDDYAGSRSYINATNAAYVNDRAYAFLVGDMHDYYGNRVGPGLQQALDGINLNNAKEYNDFGLYLVCQNGMERVSEGLRVFADDSLNTVEAMDAMSKQLEDMYPAFKDAAAKLYDFQNQLVQSWLVDTGLISKDVAKEWTERWPHYVPFNRKFTDQFGAARAAGGVKRGYGNQKAPIQQARGSGRAFVNPVDNIMNNLIKYVTAGSYNMVASKITNTATITDGGAAFLEKVPSPLKKKEFDITGLKDQLKKLTEDSKLTSDDKNAMIEIVTGLDDILTQYGRGKAHGDVITVMKSGKPEFFKINDPMLLDSLVNMSPAKLPGALEMYGRFTRFTMAATTGYNVVWSLMSNAPRDLGAVFTYSKDRNPIHIFGAMGEAYINKIKGSKADTMYKEFVAMGGGRVSAYSADKNLAKTVRQKLTGNKMQYFNPLNWLDFVGDLIELGPRYAYYKICRSRYGMSAHEAFYAAMDLTTNFKKRGSAASMKMLNNIIPYNNASIQGLDKFGRWISGNDAPASERSKTARRRVIAMMAASAGIAAMLMAVNGIKDDDRENYAQLSNYTKNSYWCVPLGEGKYFCVPKPREIAVLTSFFEASIERFVYGNENAYDEFYDYAADNMLPNAVNDVAAGDLNGFLGNFGIISALYGVSANKDFLGKPIVSAGLENLEPKDQYTDRTSKLALAIGKAFNVSPQKVDYFAGQTLGGFWKWQKALFPVGSENTDLTLGIQSSYVKDNQYSTDVVNNLYTSYEDLKRKRGSNSNDMDIAVAFKDVSSLTTFYSRYNALAKNLPESEYNRAVRQTVLEMIIEHNKSASSGISTGVHDAVAAICKQQGDTELMPSTMNTYVTADDGTQYTLTAAQYVEYQTNYNRLYWEYVEDALSTANNQSAAYKAALVKAAKGRALTEAKGGVLSTKGVTNKDYTLAKSLENYGIDGTEHILFKAALDMVNEGGGSPTNDEIIEAINGMDGLTNRERYYLYHSKNDKDNNNPYAKYK